ncbi:MAG TPA: type 2 lanthipeptide synthetase LanM, partial [Thermoanaerobaculia bacterium]|nr:type 2 lanthipeptide synthetase LanM [Thermoanaerobaculia bacterium]
MDLERAEHREHRWRSQVPFSQDGFFARRLAADGLSAASFRYLLGEPSEDLARRAGEAPDWLATLEGAFSTEALDSYPAPSLPKGAHAHLAFFEVVRPLLDAGTSRLRREIRKLAAGREDLPFDPDTAADLSAGSLASRLILLLGRTMVLELNLAGREGRLIGDTPEARFQSFATSLRDRETALGILCQYPVLARQVVETVDRWVEVSLDFLRHLRDDATALRATFFPDFDPGPLVRIEGGLGDSHRGGRSVVIAELASGLRLVYKPKPMRVERAFQNLLAWVGEKGFAPAYRLLRMVNGGDHGWVEMVEASPCSTREEMERFYRRQGGYLALLYLLSATDFHHENLIAAGEHPVLVDLEALFHPWAEDLGRAAEEGLRMGRPVFETVLRTGLLPLRSREGDGGQGGLDLSGLAATAGQMAPVLMNEQAGTDAMRYVRRELEIPVGQHRPTLQGAEVSLREFLGPLLDGFTSMARLLAEHREELAAPGSVLDAFADSEVRVILRPTRTYATLLVEAQHPFVLGDALDRDRLLDRLWEAVEERPCMAGLVAAERRDLLRGDVPLFTARPDSRDLWASDGERFPGFLPFSGLEAARERLARFGEEDLARQAWIIHDSIEALTLKGQDLPPYPLDPRTRGPSRE